MMALLRYLRVERAWSQLAGKFETRGIRLAVMLFAVALGWLIANALTANDAYAAESQSQPAAAFDAAPVATPVDSRAVSAAPVVTTLLTPVTSLAEPVTTSVDGGPVVTDDATVGSSLLNTVFNPLGVDVLGTSANLAHDAVGDNVRLGGPVLHSDDANDVATIAPSGPNADGQNVDHIADSSAVTSGDGYQRSCDFHNDNDNGNAMYSGSGAAVHIGSGAEKTLAHSPLSPMTPLAAVPAATGGVGMVPTTGSFAPVTAATISEFMLPEMSDGDVVGTSVVTLAPDWRLTSPSVSPD